MAQHWNCTERLSLVSISILQVAVINPSSDINLMILQQWILTFSLMLQFKEVFRLLLPTKVIRS